MKIIYFKSLKTLVVIKKYYVHMAFVEILDLTNDLPIGQSSLFTPSQWNYLKNEFITRKVKHLPELSKSLDRIISEVKKVLYIYMYMSL